MNTPPRMWQYTLVISAKDEKQLTSVEVVCLLYGDYLDLDRDDGIKRDWQKAMNRAVKAVSEEKGADKELRRTFKCTLRADSEYRICIRYGDNHKFYVIPQNGSELTHYHDI